MINSKNMLIVSLLAAGVVGGLALHTRPGRAASLEPAQVVMLSCSTESDQFQILSVASTNPAIRIDPKTVRCVDALKVLLDADLKVVDIAYGDGGRRVTYTILNAAPAQDFNVSRSNKDKG